MKAVVTTDYGPPERFTVSDVPVPRPDTGQIQVRISSASVNPGDIKVPSGSAKIQAVPSTRWAEAHVPSHG